MTVGFTEMIWTDFHSYKFSLLLSATSSSNSNDTLISFLKIIDSTVQYKFYWQGWLNKNVSLSYLTSLFIIRQKWLIEVSWIFQHHRSLSYSFVIGLDTHYAHAAFIQIVPCDDIWSYDQMLNHTNMAFISYNYLYYPTHHKLTRL